MTLPTEPRHSHRAPAAVGPYPHARQAGEWLFLSGIGPRERGSNAIPGNVYDDNGQLSEYDIAAQCHAVFANLRYVLEDAGSHWDNLVDLTVFLTDMERDFKTFNRLYADYFPDHQPTRTTLGISALPTPIAIELKALALAGSGPSDG